MLAEHWKAFDLAFNRETMIPRIEKRLRWKKWLQSVTQNACPCAILREKQESDQIVNKRLDKHGEVSSLSDLDELSDAISNYCYVSFIQRMLVIAQAPG